MRRIIGLFYAKFAENNAFTSSKWAKIAKCSQDTAIRDIQDLIQKGVLEKEAAGGRSTSHRIVYKSLRDH